MMGSTDELSLQQIAEEYDVSPEYAPALEEAIDTLDGLGVSYHIWTREQSEAFELLTSFEGNGWICPVSIFVPVESAQNQSEAWEACTNALGVLWIMMPTYFSSVSAEVEGTPGGRGGEGCVR